MRYDRNRRSLFRQLFRGISRCACAGHQPAHAGRFIDKLRIDPIGSAGTWFEIDWIRAAGSDADFDGISDNEEDMVDSDGDGIRDYLDWDSDNDGFADLYENAVGTDPRNAFDYGFFETGSGIPVQLNGRAERLYSLQWTGSLIPPGWSTVETTGPLAVNLPIVFTNGTPSTSGFYRVQVEKP